jgi:hypothetical protein
MSSEHPSTPSTEAPTPTEVLERNDANAKRIENVNHLASLAYKIAIAIGAIVVFSYLFSIKFFPSALAPGEVILFVFIALAFSFIYGILWIYGTFSALWLLQLVSYIRGKCRFRRRKLSPFPPLRYIQEIAALPTSRWWPRLRWIPRKIRQFRKGATRNSRTPLNKLPSPLRGVFPVSFSLVVYIVMLSLVLVKGLMVFTLLLIGCFLAGFFTLLMLIAVTSSEQPDADTRQSRRSIVWWQYAFFFFLPLAFVLFYSGPMTLPQMAFNAMGIRSSNVSIEVAEAELGAIERATEFIGRPILDCRRTAEGRLLLHGADVLWTGIGAISLVSFSLRGPDRSTIFGTEQVVRKKTSLRFDSVSSRVITSSPAMDICFDLTHDLGFESHGEELSADIQERLHDVVLTVRGAGVPRSMLVLVQGVGQNVLLPYDKDGNKYLQQAQLRARVVANAIRKVMNDDNIKIVSEAGFSAEAERDRVVAGPCTSDVRTSSFDWKRCDTPNFQVELHVKYATAHMDEPR